MLGEDKQVVGGGGKDKIVFFVPQRPHSTYKRPTLCGAHRLLRSKEPGEGLTRERKKADLAFSVSPRVKSDEGASGGSVHWVCVRGQHHLDKPESTCSCD